MFEEYSEEIKVRFAVGCEEPLGRFWEQSYNIWHKGKVIASLTFHSDREGSDIGNKPEVIEEALNKLLVNEKR